VSLELWLRIASDVRQDNEPPSVLPDRTKLVVEPNDNWILKESISGIS
jgi:hypothetical protein